MSSASSLGDKFVGAFFGFVAGVFAMGYVVSQDGFISALIGNEIVTIDKLYGTVEIRHADAYGVGCRYDYIAGTVRRANNNFSDFSGIKNERLLEVARMAQTVISSYIQEEQEKGNTLPNWLIAQQTFFDGYVAEHDPSLVEMGPPVPGP